MTNNAWDSNLIKANGKFISVNWNSSGGGAFAVIPVDETGKAPDQVPLFRGHTAQVLDTEFNPFNDRIIVSSSDDAKIGVWEIPEDYSFHSYVDEDGNPKDIKPLKFLTGHSRKVGHVLFHPTANNVLASSSLDYTVKLWDIESGKEIFTLEHPNMVTSMSFSYDGNHLATVCRDKKLRVWDIRAKKVVSEGLAHSSAKNQRVVWLGNSDRIATTGFSRLSDRQIGIWDAFNIEKGDLGGFYTVDQSSGILMPFYDDSNKILYLVGKGDGNIRYFEFQNDELFELSEYQSVEPQRGFAVAPRRSVNVKDNEILKGYKTVRDHCIEPISFYVPRKSEIFQDDIYPDAPSDKYALTSEEWISGKSVEGPILFSVKTLYDGSDPIFSPAVTAEAKKEKSHDKSETEVKSESPKPMTATQEKAQTEPRTVSEPGPKKGQSPTDSVDDVLKNDKSVDKLLQKACSLDEINNSEDPSRDTSDWDEEDDKVTLVEPKKEEPKKEEPKKEEPKEEEPKEEEPKKEEPKKEEPKKEEPKKEEPKKEEPKKKEPKKEEPKKEEIVQTAAVKESTPAPTSTPANTKSLGLKQSVEKLSSLVLHLEGVVTKLTEANLEKDDRLKQLEFKIQELLKK